MPLHQSWEAVPGAGACTMAAASVGHPEPVTSHGLVPIAFPRESSLNLGTHEDSQGSAQH